MKYLIDTDIGDDIDDAFALGYALKKKLDVIGITTVYRNALARANLAKELLASSGLSIPVYPGLSVPLSKGSTVFGRTNYGLEDEAPYDPSIAIDFIGEMAKEYGEDLTIVCIGAQSNLAAAYLRYGPYLDKVHQVVVMGGCFNAQRNEWNISEDPHAAKIVASSGMRLFYVPIEITEQTSIGESNFRKILAYKGNGIFGTVARFTNEWRERNLYKYVPIIHDPATLICYLDRDLCETEDIDFAVLDSGPGCGLTLNVSNLDLTLLPKVESKRITIVTQIASASVIKEFMDTLFKDS